MEIVDTRIEKHQNLSLEASFLRAIAPLENFENIYDDMFDSLYSPHDVEQMIDGLRILQEMWTQGFMPLLFKIQKINLLLYDKFEEKGNPPPHLHLSFSTRSPLEKAPMLRLQAVACYLMVILTLTSKEGLADHEKVKKEVLSCHYWKVEPEHEN